MRRWFVLSLTLLCVAACGGGSVQERTADSVTKVPTATPTPELLPGPGGWILHECEELNVAIYHPPDWTAALETLDPETGSAVRILTVSHGEAPPLMIGENPDLGGTSAEQWANEVLPSMNADAPGAFSLKLREPFTTLDGIDGVIVVVQSTQFSVGSFQGVAIYQETAFIGAALMLGGSSDEEDIATYKGILETLQRR